MKKMKKIKVSDLLKMAKEHHKRFPDTSLGSFAGVKKFKDLSKGDYFFFIKKDQDGQYVESSEEGLEPNALNTIEFNDEENKFEYTLSSLGQYRDVNLMKDPNLFIWDMTELLSGIEEEDVLVCGSYYQDNFIKKIRSGKTKIWINALGNKQKLDQEYQRGRS